ncbi:glutathione peroxidase [Periweissella ghanensis]|uniref:Glutathione peroxidase n=1 Tax=Periweissella ghanensis TaxID=467997 RepID=A0ABN8BQL1_9LACO|nr:glutathione peroxidase [Periweissella ghanensis]MCM0600009.1 glutathione peroxidase [Periweissella ghanensis]CAH0418935.1 Glutathione peroxidase BsaA [Periweissella ghanensis]
MTSIYDFTVTDEQGNAYQLDRYKGQPMIIVNTATKCGLAPQFNELETLYKKYADQGLVVLGFPSNQFKQEENTTAAAAEACRMTYGVTFPMHDIIQVNGDSASPLFKYLKHEQPGTLGSAIKWNFTKFLVDKDGHVIKRYAPQTEPSKIEPDLQAVL